MQKRSEKRIGGAMMALAATAILLLAVCQQGMAFDLMQIGKQKLKHANTNNNVYKLVPSQELMKLNIPVNVSHMPAQWQQATLEVGGGVFFLDDAGVEVLGLGQEANYDRKEIALINGNYTGVVSFSISEVMGQATPNACGVGLVMAVLGSDKVLLGASVGGPAAGTAFCSTIADAAAEAASQEGTAELYQP